ncbi:hypothetical protein BH23VER1_BH23VER1_19130 [soil metagenome]
MKLLVSLGTSAAIVPEAYLVAGLEVSEIHVLTSASPSVDVSFVATWFAKNAPQVALTIAKVAGFDSLMDADDHERFEEVLFRWVLEKRGSDASGAAAAPPSFCLSGGFKTMSASVQKAAEVFGATEVFHVICNLDQQPVSPGEISAAHAGGHLHAVRLGASAGWPQLAEVSATDFPLDVVAERSGVRSLAAPRNRTSLRARVRDLSDRINRIAGAWDQVSQLPFVILATWSPADLGWLQEPLDSVLDRPWVESLPKVELHCHLGGFATSGSLLEDVRAAAADPDGLPSVRHHPPPEGWPLPPEPVPLEAYMALGNDGGSAVLGDLGCLRRQCQLLYAEFCAQGVHYAEVRCSPGNYAAGKRGRSPWAVLAEIRDAFQSCMDGGDPGSIRCHVNLIVIATRRREGDYRAAISRHLALAVSAAEHETEDHRCRVVGVDLAGWEDTTTRAHYFREEFSAVHRCGLALTVHAGENDDAEGIWRAVFDLHARRIGHGLRLLEAPELLRSVADRGIGIEMCPYANYQIRGFDLDAGGGRRPYPLAHYLAEGVRVSVNTDNIGISSASLADNILLAARLCPGLSRLDVLRLLRNAVDMAFVRPSARAEMITSVESALRPPSARRHAAP